MKKSLFSLMVVFAFVFPLHAFAQTWIQVNTGGFGDLGNTSSRSMAVYNNKLYVGTVNNPTGAGAEVWKLDGINWTQVNTDGFGDTSNKAALSMAVFNNNLYVGTQNASTGTQVWRYDGTSWSQVNTGGFGDPNNRLSASMAVYKDNLYVGTRNPPPGKGTQIWRYDGGTDWTQVNTDGFGTTNNLRSVRMVVYKGSLYTGTENASTGTQIWRYDGGTDWTKVNTDGFGDPNNGGSFSMAVHDNYLYVGTENKATGTEIWRYDGTNWTQVNTDGFGNLNNAISFSMAAFGRYLYVGTDNASTGTEIWRYDGTTWTQVNTDGFGDANNASSVSMTVYNNDVYVGIENATSGAGVFMSAQFVATAGDDFNDNKMDLTKWGKDKVKGGGHLSETGGRLEYLCGKGKLTSSDRPWKLRQFPSDADWSVQIDVTNNTSPSVNQWSSFGINVEHVVGTSNKGTRNEIEVELAAFGQSKEVYAEFRQKGIYRGDAVVGTPDFSAPIRMTFDATTKVFTVACYTDLGRGPQWYDFGTFGVGPSGGGANGNADWGLTANDKFIAYVFGYSENMAIDNGQLYGDNFEEIGGVPPALLWTDHDELGGGESKATGVATLGSKIYVAVSGKDDNASNWNGQVRIYKSTGGLIWKSDPFPLKGGQTTQIAVSGSQVYVAGYYGTAGSGDEEEVFVRAYDASGKGFKWEYKASAPYVGLYPVGVAAQGSNIVAFFNETDLGSPVRGTLIGLVQKTGALKWASDFIFSSDVSSKVNAIAMKGSMFAAVGYSEAKGGHRGFWVYGYSAVDGGWDWGEGISLSGDENEALAVSWNGSIVAVAGYLSSGPSSRIGYARYIEVSSRATSGHQLDSVSELQNSRFTSVVVSGKKIYAAGYGMDGSEQKAFVRAYDITNHREYPDAHLWDDTFDLTSSGGMVTTGITLAKNQVCVSGYGLEGGPGTTDWFVKAYDLNGNIKWFDDFNLHGGNDTRAFGIAASSSAIVAVGQAENGPGGLMEMTVRAYKP